MHRFDIFLVVAVIATAGEALSVAENLWDTASDLLTSSSSNEEAMAVQDVTDSGVYSPQEIIAEALCSAPSNDQSRKKQPSKFRRRQDCSPTRSRYKTSPPNAQEQGQQPHQTSSPDNKESNPSDAAANNAAAIDRSGFIDNFQLCNPLLVGKYREFPVCDSGKWQDRSMFRVRADTVNNVMVSGVYVLFDVMPGIYPPAQDYLCTWEAIEQVI